MITKFKMFEEHKPYEGYFGSIIGEDKFKYIPNIIQYLKDKNIKYDLFYNRSNFFILLFTNSTTQKVVKTNIKDITILVWNKKERIKFPKDNWNEDNPFLPILDGSEEIDYLEIQLLAGGTMDYFMEDAYIVKDIKDIDIIIQSNKYNI
jgi:hypothetical protein